MEKNLSLKFCINNLYKFMVFGLVAVVLFGCGFTPKVVSQPEWISPDFQAPLGIIKSSQLHIQGREKTRQLIFDQALIELSKLQFGSSIALNSQVKKTTEVSDGTVHDQTTHIDYAEITSAEKSAIVKAKIKSEWYDAKTQKLYLWVQPISQ